MSNEWKNNYNNANEHFFDSTKIEIISSVAKLKPILIGAEVYLYVKLDENQGLVARDSSGNQRDGAFQGGLDENDWTTGKINSAIEGIGTTGGFINFDGTCNFVKTQSFSIEFWLSFTSLATMAIVSKQKDSGVFHGYGVNLSSGKIRFVIRDDLSNVNSIESTNPINDGFFHHIVVTYDGSGDANGMKLYIDNVDDTNITNIAILNGTILNDANFQISGRDGNNITLDIGTIVDEVAVYDRELTPAEIAFRWNGGAGTQQIPGASTSFPIDNPTIISKNILQGTTINSIVLDTIITGSDTIKGVAQVNSQKLYHDGSNWVESDGTYLQSNTLSEINTNLATLLTQPSDFNFIWFLHSNDGSTTPELNEQTINYDFEGQIIDDININTVFWYPKNADGSICEDNFIAVPDVFNIRYKDTIFICQEKIQATANLESGPEQGKLEIPLIENENMVDSEGDPIGPVGYKIFQNTTLIAEIYVPNVPSSLLWDIIV